MTFEIAFVNVNTCFKVKQIINCYETNLITSRPRLIFFQIN